MNRFGKFSKNTSPPLGLYLNTYKLMRQGLLKKRTWRDAPLYLRLNKLFYETKFGVQCRRISDMAHFRSHDAIMALLAYSRRYHVRRKMAFLLSTVGAFWLGHFVTTRANNLYTTGWN